MTQRRTREECQKMIEAIRSGNKVFFDLLTHSASWDLNDPRFENMHGYPLHNVIEADIEQETKKQMIKTLLKNGANPNLRNIKNDTVGEILLERGERSLYNLVKSSETDD